MSDSDEKIIKSIGHYQANLERYFTKQEYVKMLHCISRLHGLPITVAHLEETGVGRTVNSMRKIEGPTGDAARALVNKWKGMVAQDDPDEQNEKETESRHKHKNSSSHEGKERSKEKSRESKSHERSKKNDDKNHSEEREKKRKERKLEEEHTKDKKRSKESDSDNEHRKKHKRSKEKSSHSSDSHSSKSEFKHVKSSEKSSHKSRSADDGKEDKPKRVHSESSNNGHHKHRNSSSEEEKESSRNVEEEDSDSDVERRLISKKKRSSEKKSSDKRSSKKVRKKVEVPDDGIDCGSGASFAEALGMLGPSSSKTPAKKSVQEASPKVSTKSTKIDNSKAEVPLLMSPPPAKLESIDLNISSLLPPISTNYKPIGNPTVDSPFGNKPKQQNWDDEDLTRLMYAKNQRTKVYSGNKTFWGKVPSLFELCTRVLQDNIDAFEFTGGVPFDLLKPILEKATPDQLFMLEHHNPYLMEDTDELWNFHCQKEFRTKKREELESWREMYLRCLDERERKLKALTANIKLSQDKSLPVRQTKLAYVDSVVKPPRNVAKKQIKNGIEKKPFVTPSSRLSTLALSGGASLISVPSPARVSTSSSNNQAAMKAKKAPLMAKTLQLMKGRFRR